ncbi:hypothetical protein Vafri_5545 [Volvox africanus]|uniref:Peptidase M11 gametolysin domain-containing protein n=2 Tax=Volvox africanus TaxID=51714 RepID=A0A8J4AXF3_9CHLO|nr:hypothetical protein Vafri_5545 [Volvox africanus]
MAPANCCPRWTFRLLPYPWQQPFRASEHGFILLLVPLLATLTLALVDGALAATPTSPLSPLPTTSQPSLPPSEAPLPPSEPSWPPSEPSWPPSSGGAAITIRGKLLYRTTWPNGTWLLSSVNGTSTSYTLPYQPIEARSGNEIPPGQYVNLTCFLPNDITTMCSNITNARIYLAAAPMIATNVTLRVLVMVVSINKTPGRRCSAVKGANVTQIKDAFLGPGGYADFFENCSYGRMVFDRQMLTVEPIVIPCIETNLQCTPEIISNAAMKYLPQEISTGEYSHLLYVFPDDKEFGNKCNPSPGLGEVPGPNSWYWSSDFDKGIFSKGTVMQEILHNFGLYHGWRNKDEYGDASTCMGSGQSCPSAPELWHLGWATPLAQLNSSTFPVATYMNFTLPATYLGPMGAMIKIQPDWLDTNYYTKNLYLSLRVKAAGDKDLYEDFNGKLNIHEINSTMDNSRDKVGNDPFVTMIGERMTPGSNNVRLVPYKLLLHIGAFNDRTSTIMVTICRFVNGPDECTFAAL